MSIKKTAAILLIVAGAFGMAYGGYTSDTHTAELGSLSMSVDETQYMDVPIWAGAGRGDSGSGITDFALQKSWLTIRNL